MVNKTLFFVLGNPRSGTTLLRLMLNNHPEIVLPPECGFAEWLYEEYSSSIMDDNSYRKILAKVFSSRKFETWGLNYDDVVESIIGNKPKNYTELICEVYRSYASKIGKEPTLLGDKNNYYIRNVGKLEIIFPGCKKIFIVRDGRDVASSYKELNNKDINSIYRPKLKTNIEDIAREWSNSVETMMSWNKQGAEFIKYEDLVYDTEATLKFICDYLGMYYTGKMIEYYKHNDEPEDFKDWKEKTFSPLDHASIGRYKSDLSLDDLDRFESVASNSLHLAGYEV